METEKHVRVTDSSWPNGHCSHCWDVERQDYVAWHMAELDKHEYGAPPVYPGLGQNLKTGAKQDADRLTGYAVRLDKFVGRVRAKAVNDPKWTAAVVLATVYLVHNLKGPVKKALRGKRKFVTDVVFDDPYLLVKFNNKSEDKWDIMD